MTDLSPEQQELLRQYHQARVAWESGDHPDLATAYAAALDACLAAGVDPFHHPQPR